MIAASTTTAAFTSTHFQKLWGISSKVLYTQLADLEKDGLIVRQKLDTDEKQTTQTRHDGKGQKRHADSEGNLYLGDERSGG